MGTERTASEIIRDFRLVPLPGEGGYFRETYRADADFSHGYFSSTDDPDRRLGTAIYYLVTPESWSALHRLTVDEVYHFYAGDAVHLILADDAGRCETVALGSDWALGEHFQWTVRRGRWQGVKLRKGGSWALLGTTTFPGFEFRDCRLACQEDITSFPAPSRQILQPYLARSADSP